MRYRDYKTFAPNTYHHIYNRGNGRMDIFKDRQDYLNFIKRFKIVLNLKAQIDRDTLALREGAPSDSLSRLTPLPKDSFKVHCYCLMPNHFHFVIQQISEIPISKLILKICTSYGKYFNKKYGHVGGLFQDQFKSVPITGEGQLLWLTSYVHNNPRTAELITDLKDWSYSSYPEYLGIRDGILVNPEFILNIAGGKLAYEKFMADSYVKIKTKKDLEHLLLD